MLRLFLMGTLLLTVLGSKQAMAQVTCDQFCITDISLDTLPGLMNISIALDGDGSTFINYPFPEAVIDLQGDTVGEGAVFFFGQFGGTTTVYPCSTSLTSIPPGFQATILFRFDTVSCLLPYPCLVQSVRDGESVRMMTAFPNPASGRLYVRMSESRLDEKLWLEDLRGVTVRRELIHGGEVTLQVQDLSPGVYVLRSDRGESLRVLIE